MAEKAELGEGCAEIQVQHRQVPSCDMTWEENDPKNPKNWPTWYKIFGIATNSFMPTIVGIYASAYTAGISGIQDSFPGTSTTTVLLGGTTYLLGLALGSLMLTSLSEIYGRRPVHILSTGLHSLLVIPAALAPSPSAILASRFFGGFVVSASLSTATGSVSDLVSDEHRALAFSFWSLGAMNGAVIGPIMGGFVFQYLGWRWINWVVAICSGASFVSYCLLKETYAPVILEERGRTQHQRKSRSWWKRHGDDVQPHDWDKVKTSIIRPLKMAFTEPICLMLNLYASMFYAVLFLCFIGYPVVFEQQRRWSPGMAGLAFCGIAVGVSCAVIFEPVIRALLTRYYRNPMVHNSMLDAYMVPACVGGILVPIGQFWFSWTGSQHIHWIVPILAGVPFGFGNTLVFIYVLSYMSGSYGIYTASAVAGATAFRYVFAATLPLAGPKMYDALGVNWAGTTLGCIELILIPIPFMFYKYGARIRARSALISRLS